MPRKRAAWRAIRYVASCGTTRTATSPLFPADALAAFSQSLIFSSSGSTAGPTTIITTTAATATSPPRGRRFVVWEVRVDFLAAFSVEFPKFFQYQWRRLGDQLGRNAMRNRQRVERRVRWEIPGHEDDKTGS